MQSLIDLLDREEVAEHANVTAKAGHRIRSVSIIGGFLDGAQFEFIDGLNC